MGRGAQGRSGREGKQKGVWRVLAARQIYFERKFLSKFRALRFEGNQNPIEFLWMLSSLGHTLITKRVN